ncbi:hypothetical protein Tco_0579391 [Tanacetum coccineum]
MKKIKCLRGFRHINDRGLAGINTDFLKLCIGFEVTLLLQIQKAILNDAISCCFGIDCRIYSNAPSSQQKDDMLDVKVGLYQIGTQMAKIAAAYIKGTSTDIETIIRGDANILWLVVTDMFDELSNVDFGDDVAMKCLAAEFKREIYVVELITAIHEMLADYNNWCASGYGEEEEGMFLKLAIRYLIVSRNIKYINPINGS